MTKAVTRTRINKAADQTAAQLSAAQPWLREHYASLHDNVAPRWESTREAVAPTVAAANQRLRNDVMPAAARMSGRLADEAAQRTAPLREEIAHRAVATLAAARGIDPSAAERGRARRWKLWLIGGGAMAGAAGAVGLTVWQRKRNRQWAEAEAEAETEPEAGARVFEPEGAVIGDTEADLDTAASPDDPANADADESAAHTHSAH